MKPRSRGALTLAWHDDDPAPCWNAVTELQNPRSPSVPATLHLSLTEYFAASALIGLLSAQQKEPEMEWAARWALEMGHKMATESRRRRKRR